MYFSGERQRVGINTAIVRVLEDSKKPVSAVNIASEIGRGTPTVLKYLRELDSKGIVKLDGDMASLEQNMK
jgi:Mn-dependent DtxR family transcriptional regulator